MFFQQLIWISYSLSNSLCLLLTLSSLQCSSWLLDCSSTPSAWTPPWSGPSAGTPTSTTLASARSAGATCWLSSESCSPSSCPFLPNMHRRSSCPPPLCPRCYSALVRCLVFSLLTTLSNLGLMSWRDTCIPFLKAMLFGKPHSVITEADTQQQTLSSCICYVINSNSVHLNGMFYVTLILCGFNLYSQISSGDNAVRRWKDW